MSKNNGILGITKELLGKKIKTKDLDLFGSSWNITFCDEIAVSKDEEEEDSFKFGLCDGTNRRIAIATKSPDKSEQPIEEIEISTLHELMHAILKTGQYLHSNDDEPLVEWLARCVYSLKKQGVI